MAMFFLVKSFYGEGFDEVTNLQELLMSKPPSNFKFLFTVKVSVSESPIGILNSCFLP